AVGASVVAVSAASGGGGRYLNPRRIWSPCVFGSIEPKQRCDGGASIRWDLNAGVENIRIRRHDRELDSAGCRPCRGRNAPWSRNNTPSLATIGRPINAIPHPARRIIINAGRSEFVADRSVLIVEVGRVDLERGRLAG